jgi:hypothetical protein
VSFARPLRALLVAVALLAVAGPLQAASALIRVEPSSFDFGRALPGKALRKQFVLRNAGDAELVIERVDTSCHCTAAIAGSTRLLPGRSTALTVSLDTSGLRGHVERRVLVRSNDPKTPLVELKIQATVEAAR